MTERQMMHGEYWRGTLANGWFAQEKFDGCRAYWDGEKLWTRSGNAIPAPEWLVGKLPKVHLDGEIWAGRGRFHAARDAVAYGHFDQSVRFVVFDVPQASGNIAARLATVSLDAGENVIKAEPTKIESTDHLRKLYQGVRDNGGEGLMIHSPRAKGYERRRTANLLKVKAG